MPELPEVETIVRGLREIVLGKKIKVVKIVPSRVLQSSISSFKRNLIGKKIKGAKRRGKNIILKLSSGNFLLVHLGMTGHLFFLDKPAPLGKHDHIDLIFSDNSSLRYNDIRKFGKFKLVKSSSIEKVEDLKSLGSEPLEISKDNFARLLQRRRGRIKSTLLNQKVVAGIGNIYADEVLFEAKIYPEEKAFNICSDRLKKLHQAIGKILKEAIKAGGSSVDNYLDLEGKKGFFQFHHKIYGKKGEPCPRCRTKIKKMVLNQRSSYFCPNCQKKL